ncbi:MAG: hypothetical protein UIQ51_02050, partial [Bacteroidales bacterium]|nr:hypothetical protein [Bacteroidales bacterium]
HFRSDKISKEHLFLQKTFIPKLDLRPTKQSFNFLKSRKNLLKRRFAKTKTSVHKCKCKLNARFSALFYVKKLYTQNSIIGCITIIIQFQPTELFVLYNFYYFLEGIT